MSYNNNEVRLRETDRYSDWFSGLRDSAAKAMIVARLDRVKRGNFGDCVSVGEGVSELRIHYGPGYRVYILQRGQELVILLAVGDKSTQKRDIPAALEIAHEIKENPNGN